MAVTSSEGLSHQAFEVGACRALVARVIQSAGFSRSQRLSSFLEYVCELALSGRSHEINEQLVGQAVFGRSPGYDPTMDGIVRTQGSRLRQRLDQYFLGEGSEEPIRIVVPRGSYVPRFEERPAANDSDDGVATDAFSPVVEQAGSIPALHPIQEKRRWSLVAAWILVAILACTSLNLWLRLRRARENAPTSHPLWSQLFLPDQETLFVAEDNGLVIWEGLMKRNLSLSEFLQGKYRDPGSEPPDSTAAIASRLSNRRYTTIVSLEAVQLFSGIARSEKSTMNIRFAREVRPNDLRDNNVVLLGATEANPWLSLFEPRMNFVFSNDRIHNASIVNKHPQGNEPQEWLSKGEPANLVYAIVDYLPGTSGKHNALIVAGTSMMGTECALNFISDDKLLGPFLMHIRRPDGTLPHFEVVLGTHFISGNALVPSVRTWRVID